MFGCEFRHIKKAFEFIENWLGRVDYSLFMEALEESEQLCIENARGTYDEEEAPTFMQYQHIVLGYTSKLEYMPIQEIVPVMEYMCDSGGYDLAYFILKWNDDVNPEEVVYWMKDKLMKETFLMDYEFRTH
jgi:hypothetical protein